MKHEPYPLEWPLGKLRTRSRLSSPFKDWPLGRALDDLRDELDRLGAARIVISSNLPVRLGGKDLACWCKPDEPCHADVLLRIANGGTPPGRAGA